MPKIFGEKLGSMEKSPYIFSVNFCSLNYIHMKKETIDQLYKAFEQYALEVNGVECWSARELQLLLGYSKWENFTNVINNAVT